MMNKENILQADVLEIIFDGRNKLYGAYELRTNYKRRLLIAVTSMLMICGLMLLLYSIASGRGNDHVREYVINDHTLDEVKVKEEEPPVVEQPKPKPQEQIATQQFTTPLVTHEEVKPEEMPPQTDELENTRIGLADQDGKDDDGIVAPPIDDKGTGVTEVPKKKDEEPEIWMDVQIQSAYPDGIEGWKRFLNKNLRYPQDAVDKEIQGPVVVQFVVDIDGTVSNVEAVSGPKELWAEAVRVIKKSGKWTPAIQNGRQVKSYKRQPIVFQLAEE